MRLGTSVKWHRQADCSGNIDQMEESDWMKHIITTLKRKKSTKEDKGLGITRSSIRNDPRERKCGCS